MTDDEGQITIRSCSSCGHSDIAHKFKELPRRDDKRVRFACPKCGSVLVLEGYEYED